MALGSTQPLIEMSIRNIFWHFHVLIVWKSVGLKILEPSGPVQTCTGTALPLQRHRGMQHLSNEYHNFVHTVAVSNCSVRNWQWFQKESNWKQKKTCIFQIPEQWFKANATNTMEGLPVLLSFVQHAYEGEANNSLLMRQNRVTNERVTLLLTVSPHF